MRFALLRYVGLCSLLCQKISAAAVAAASLRKLFRAVIPADRAPAAAMHYPLVLQIPGLAKMQMYTRV